MDVDVGRQTKGGMKGWHATETSAKETACGDQREYCGIKGMPPAVEA
jgi:hypothetical protein